MPSFVKLLVKNMNVDYSVNLPEFIKYILSFFVLYDIPFNSPCEFGLRFFPTLFMVDSSLCYLLFCMYCCISSIYG